MFFVVSLIQQNGTGNMATIIKLNSKSIKKFIAEYGVKVLRCQSNGFGLIITVSNSKENIELAKKFLLEFGLSRQNGLSAEVVGSGNNYADFGTLFYRNVD